MGALALTGRGCLGAEGEGNPGRPLELSAEDPMWLSLHRCLNQDFGRVERGLKSAPVRGDSP